MDDEKYSNVFKTFRLFYSSAVCGFVSKDLAETSRQCYSEVAAKEGRGLRILAIGPAHGQLLEDTIYTAGNAVKIVQLDCVEPNTHMVIELKQRMASLARNFTFSYTIHNKHFSKESGTYLPNGFYDLLIFSQVLYYFDDPACVLETALYQLANSNGRGFIVHDPSDSIHNICDEVQHLLFKQKVESAPHNISKTVDIPNILANIKTRVMSYNKTETATVCHMALIPSRPCISERDREFRKTSDELLSFLSQTDVSKLSDDQRSIVQNIISKYTTNCYGFPVLLLPTEIFVIARI